VILGVQISKKKGCKIELEDSISGVVWKIKTRGAFNSRNIPFQKWRVQLQKRGVKMKTRGAFSS